MTKDANVFIDDCDRLLAWIEAVHKLITETKPHPIDEDALDEYKEQLMVSIVYKSLELFV